MKNKLSLINKEVEKQNLRLKELEEKYANVNVDKELFRIKNLDEKLDYTSIQAEIRTELSKQYDYISENCSNRAFKYMVTSFINLFITLLLARLSGLNFIVDFMTFITIFTTMESVFNKVVECIFNNKAIYEREKITYYNNFFMSCSLEKELLLKDENTHIIEDNLIDDTFDYNLVKDNLFTDKDKTLTRKKFK